MTQAQERQVNAERVIIKLRQKNEELSYQVSLMEAMLDELQEELDAARVLIDKLAPTEGIEDGEEEGTCSTQG